MSQASVTFRKSGLWSGIAQYFQVSHKIYCDLKPDQQVIVGVHPHGIHCLPLSSFTWLDGEWAKRFPSHKMVGLAASVIFWIPMLREVFLWSGYVDASRHVAQRALKHGGSLYVCTGGEAESLMTVQGKDIVVLNHRRGFIRLALSYGADLVPTYGFGNTDMYTTLPWAHKLRMWLSKAYQIALPLFYGRWFTMTPYRCKVTVVSGPAIVVPKPEVKGGQVDEELVTKYLDVYKTELKKLFDTHKAECGFPDRELVIL